MSVTETLRLTPGLLLPIGELLVTVVDEDRALPELSVGPGAARPDAVLGVTLTRVIAELSDN